jgi:hypothetical protein
VMKSPSRFHPFDSFRARSTWALDSFAMPFWGPHW